MNHTKPSAYLINAIHLRKPYKIPSKYSFEAPIPSPPPKFDALQEPVKSIELELPDDRLSVMEHELPGGSLLCSGCRRDEKGIEFGALSSFDS